MGIPPILPQARILPGNPGIRPGSRPARTTRHHRTVVGAIALLCIGLVGLVYAAACRERRGHVSVPALALRCQSRWAARAAAIWAIWASLVCGRSVAPSSWKIRGPRSSLGRSGGRGTIWK
jgi:hypothetical protein